LTRGKERKGGRGDQGRRKKWRERRPGEGKEGEGEKKRKRERERRRRRREEGVDKGREEREALCKGEKIGVWGEEEDKEEWKEQGGRRNTFRFAKGDRAP
jgi:hypothetical protein